MTEFDTMRARAEALHLHGLVPHWPEVATEAWVAPLLERVRGDAARLPRSGASTEGSPHRPLQATMCDFDWNWPVHAAAAPRFTH